MSNYEPEVIYAETGSIYRVDPSTGEYSGKIDVFKDHEETYLAKDSTWSEYTHIHTDKGTGESTTCHGYKDTGHWKDHFRD